MKYGEMVKLLQDVRDHIYEVDGNDPIIEKLNTVISELIGLQIHATEVGDTVSK